MDAAPLINGPDDFNFVTTADLRKPAQTFRTNIYMFCETDELEQAHWDCFTENKTDPNKGRIYLKAGMSGKKLLALSQKIRGKLFNFDDINYYTGLAHT